MPLGWIFTVIRFESTTQLQNAHTLPRPVSTWVRRRAMAAACARASVTEAASAARDRAHMVVVERASIDTDHPPHIDADHPRHTSANDDHAHKSDTINSLALTILSTQQKHTVVEQRLANCSFLY